LADFRLPTSERGTGSLHHAPVLRLAGGFPGGGWGAGAEVGSGRIVENYSLPMTAVLTAAVRYFWPCFATPTHSSHFHSHFLAGFFSNKFDKATAQWLGFGIIYKAMSVL